MVEVSFSLVIDPSTPSLEYSLFLSMIFSR